MSAKPKQLKAVSAVEPEPETEAEGPDDAGFQRFLETLSSGEWIDLDEAAGGLLAQASTGEGEFPITLRLMAACGWILRRRSDPKLTWAKVRRMPFEDMMAMVAEWSEHAQNLGPKAPSARP